jgi:hypothetical protein
MATTESAETPSGKVEEHERLDQRRAIERETGQLIEGASIRLLKGLRSICSAIRLGGLGANCLLYLYIEWQYDSPGFVESLLPFREQFLWINTFFTLLTFPLFWILLAVTGIALVAVYRLDKAIESRAVNQ